MSSERRTLLLACHANADQSTKVHFGKNMSGNNLPKEPYDSETESVTISSSLQFWCLIALNQTIFFQNAHMCVCVPLGEKLATTVGVTKYLKSKLSLAFPL